MAIGEDAGGAPLTIPESDGPDQEETVYRTPGTDALTAGSHIVEPLIALSVAYVGIENRCTSRLHPWRVFVVFGVGLLHGLGFAEALAALHLNRADLLTTLLSFNVGIELGQLTVVAGAATVFFAVRRARAEWHRPATRFASAGVGLMGVVWMIERLV